MSTLALFSLLLGVSGLDWRNLDAGHLILQDAYLDQPYVAVVQLPSGGSRWVATITRNSLPEGSRGEHVECLYSDDAGATWSTPALLEPGAGTVQGLTNAYSSILATAFGRLYVSYCLNLDNVTHFPNGTPFTRDDTQGAYVARWSDDSGVSWSSERLVLPVRQTEIDRENVPFQGSLAMFWSVDQYKQRPGGDATVYLGFTKIGTYLYSPPEESFFFVSPNMATEPNVSALLWNTVPAGDTGVVSAPRNTVIEETHIIPLSQGGGGGCFAVFRTDQCVPAQRSPGTTASARLSLSHTHPHPPPLPTPPSPSLCRGHLGAASTRDPLAASGWGPAHAASFWSFTPSAAATGAVLRNPRGPVTLKQLPSHPGRYLLLFYNNGDPGFTSRNPYWLAVGVEDAALGEVTFSQPEVALYYAQDAAVRPGYPDLVQDASAAGRATPACPTPSHLGCTVFLTETNKTHARVHGLLPDTLALLLRQDSISTPASAGLALTFPAAAQGQAFPTPPLPAFQPVAAAAQAGLSLELWLGPFGAGAASGQALVDVQGANGTGLRVGLVSLATPGGAGELTLQLALQDSRGTHATYLMDANCAWLLNEALESEGKAHVVLIVDASAHIAMAVVQGLLCNGAGQDVQGWQWLPLALGDLQQGAASSFVWGGSYGGALLGGRWYTRAITVTEAIGNSRAGPPSALGE